jgi:hypothetical protein
MSIGGGVGAARDDVPGLDGVAVGFQRAAAIVAAVVTRARMWLRPGGLVATPGLTAQLEAGW